MGEGGQMVKSMYAMGGCHSKCISASDGGRGSNFCPSGVCILII